MENNKIPGNDGITKEFYEKFWLKIKSPLFLSFKKGFLTEELSTSQNKLSLSSMKKKEKTEIKSQYISSILTLN